MALDRIGRGLAALATLLLAACAPAVKDLKPALAEADSGNIWFKTPGRLVRNPNTGVMTPSSEPEVISGTLYFPEGKGPFPAVILAHGCSGPGNADAGWAPLLREWGYATFVLDSFRGRGLREVCTNSAALVATQRIPDMYGALNALSTHPRINRNRIALMGFSHGGEVTVSASTAWARDRYLAKGTPGFRLFLPFYPWCNTNYPEIEKLAAPVRVHTGALDDWTPAAPCEARVKQARAAGQDVEITLYAGAHHGFDNPGVLQVTRLPNVQNYGKCFWTAKTILGPFSGQAQSTCRVQGATIGMNAAAVAQARTNVRRQLAELLR